MILAESLREESFQHGKEEDAVTHPLAFLAVFVFEYILKRDISKRQLYRCRKCMQRDVMGLHKTGRRLRSGSNEELRTTIRM